MKQLLESPRIFLDVLPEPDILEPIASGGFPVWAIILIAVFVLFCVAAVLIALKVDKKRMKSRQGKPNSQNNNQA